MSKDDFTTMKYESWHGKYSISIPNREPKLENIMIEVVEPLLLAAGYHQKTIDNYFGRTCY